ncbi:MAG TPA: PilZ domain-containing protein [Terriglobia bacterium]|jgi:hypothetical protein|nr:PilZ domain-containing protein [Terriglobia bacterium]
MPSDLPREARKRSIKRTLAPVRIRVIGNDAQGVAFVEESVTVSFNQQGARISLTHSLLPDDIILVRNLENGIEEEFRVVGSLQEVFGDRREWGVEPLNPESGIWGVQSRSPAEGIQPKALIECAACQRAAQTTLSTIEYDVLLATGLISRHCDRCNETTRWRPSEQGLTAEVIAAGAKVTKPAVERRKLKRVRLIMHLQVRSRRGVTDIAQTRDVSKAGLCFVSGNRFEVGEEVFITLPFANSIRPTETKAKILWTAEGGGGRFYGVRYTS